MRTLDCDLLCHHGLPRAARKPLAGALVTTTTRRCRRFLVKLSRLADAAIAVIKRYHAVLVYCPPGKRLRLRLVAAVAEHHRQVRSGATGGTSTMSTMYHVMLTMYITNNRAVDVGADGDRKVAVDVLKRRHRHVGWLSGNIVHGLGLR